ncbi:MAG: glutamate-5-semialdehyde dehydrogenase [Opitutaceae bacterium]
MSDDVVSLVTGLAQRARAAAWMLGTASTEAKNAALEGLAELLAAREIDILAANREDLAAATGLARPMVDRLTLNPERLGRLAASVRQVAALPDPVGEVLEEWTRPNGLRIRKVRVPIGVMGIIYESRPNVTVDCSVLCLKSGNAAILRGGKESFRTNLALADAVAAALRGAGLPADAVQTIPTPDRAALEAMLKLDRTIDCLIPRGGEGLIRFVAENSAIPVLKHYNGVCFVYLDRAADAEMAERIVVNAKTQRPGVCNAAEQLLVHREAARSLLPGLGATLVGRGVELRCDAASAAILEDAGVPHRPAAPKDFATEFLDLVLAIRIVGTLDDAIVAINRDGSAHTDAIVTSDEAAARRFQAGVDSAVVLWNASTRFNDGFEFGYGAEIGISTDRLHARGPVGLRELCTHKFLVIGNGQIRDG